MVSLICSYKTKNIPMWARISLKVARVSPLLTSVFRPVGSHHFANSGYWSSQGCSNLSLRARGHFKVLCQNTYCLKVNWIVLQMVCLAFWFTRFKCSKSKLQSWPSFQTSESRTYTQHTAGGRVPLARARNNLSYVIGYL